jgi:hypothetical protein
LVALAFQIFIAVKFYFLDVFAFCRGYVGTQDAALQVVQAVDGHTLVHQSGV